MEPDVVRNAEGDGGDVLVFKGFNRRRNWLAITSASIGFVTVISANAHAAALGALASEAPQSVQSGVRTVTDIVSQPMHDVGLLNADIPDVLVRAISDPYALAPIPSCEQLSSEIAELSALLGPDVDAAKDQKENRVEKIAVAGGKSVMGSIIPFRMLVREVSGAAPAQRRYQAAMDIGFARRGFLRGVYQMRNCQP